jgi:D-alanyl-lipoteichoic acid acyltransferase DltB (MBOAT superfamily)
LLFASYAFYGSVSWKMSLLLLLATTISYLAALQARRSKATTSSAIVFVAVSALTAILVAFKLRPLFLHQNILLPLGISYYTFRLIGYLLDVHWGKCEPVRNFVSFATYVAFFPQILAGPIQRADSFIAQLERGPATEKPLEGILRITLGFAKKAIVADNLGLYVGFAYNHLPGASPLPSLIALLVYPLQLYADFSGLTDIAIGTGLLFGIDAPENFNAPFSATSMTEFWRRWHMTLTGWLRDYVFIPLRMATRDLLAFGLALSLTVNMALIGLWHGVSTGFLLYGLFQAAFLVGEALTLPQRREWFAKHTRTDRFAAFLGPIYVYAVVAIGFVPFRAPSLNVAAQVLSGMVADWKNVGADLSALAASPNYLHAWIAFPAFALTAFADSFRRKHGFQLPARTPGHLRWFVYSGIATIWILTAMAMLATEKGSDPFVYGLF